MSKYRSEHLADLARQLGYAPAARLRRQLDRAEQLYWQLDPERTYPLSYVTFRVTGYRPDAADEEAVLVGQAVRDDLLTMVYELSGPLEDKPERYDPPPLTNKQVAEQLNVTERTIARYRRQGLFARQLVYPAPKGPRLRVAFLPASVQRFADTRGAKLAEAARFARIDEPTRHAIITRARRIAGRAGASPFRVAQHLAGKYDRSVEAIRRLLIQHDEHDPRFAIFPDHTPPLTERQQRVILRAYRRGVPVSRMAERYNRSRDAIYRAIHLRRAAELRARPIHYVPSPTFELDDAERIILGTTVDDSAPAPTDRAANGRVQPSEPTANLPEAWRRLVDQPEPGRDAERAMFVRYNYLKYRAAQLIERLDRHRPSPGRIDEAVTFGLRASLARQRLVEAYLPLVIAAARRHWAGLDAPQRPPLMDLLRAGNAVLAEAIERYDAGRGRRFTTYLNWALMRRFAQGGGAEAGDDTADAVEGPRSPDRFVALLGELDERQRWIITRHFGLADGEGERGEPQTLASIAKELGISAEQARQAEHRALVRLREAAGRRDVALSPALPPGV